MFTKGGKIKLFLGPMFSGKSTALSNTVLKYGYKNKKTVFVNYIGDKRYTDDGHIVTHEQQKYKALVCQELKEKLNELMEYDVIGIDEGQFFPDLVEICDLLCQNGKIVVVAALSGDFRMKPFPNVSNLISKADKIQLLKAYCAFCQKSAGCTLRTVKCDKTLLVGAAEMYKPVCKSCHYANYVPTGEDKIHS